MKKIFTLALALSSILAVSAQSVKLIKNGEVIAQYSVGEFDEIVFVPAENSVDILAATYPCLLQVTLVEMDMGVVVEKDADVVVTVNENNTLNLSFPSCFYEAMGMTLPALTLSGVAVTENENAFSFDTAFEETEEGTGKAYSGSASGNIVINDQDNSVQEYSFNVKMTYGSMPFTLNMKYTKPVTEE